MTMCLVLTAPPGTQAAPVLLRKQAQVRSGGGGKGGCHGHKPVQREVGQREVQMQVCEAPIHTPSSLMCSHISDGLIPSLSSQFCFPDGTVPIFAFELVLICRNPGLPKLDSFIFSLAQPVFVFLECLPLVSFLSFSTFKVLCLNKGFWVLRVCDSRGHALSVLCALTGVNCPNPHSCPKRVATVLGLILQ